MYVVENYKDNKRFNSQYNEICRFLKISADRDYNEHFHWGRFAWMMTHSYLEIAMLPHISLFRNNTGQLVGMVVYDTSYDDRWYIIHSVSDKELLMQMIEYVTEMDAGSAVIKANSKDAVLCNLLENSEYREQYSDSVLEMDLSHNISFHLPQGFSVIDSSTSKIDNWKWRMSIHRGFDNEGIPQMPSDEQAKNEKYLEISEYIKAFAVENGEYDAHCGVWYDFGDTAYIEPVVTVPEHRNKGLGKAVVYKALSIAKQRGAKRAIVLSDQDFYLHIGMTKSSEVGTWVKK